MTTKPKMRTIPTPETVLSFPSKGPVLTDQKQTITNDHSTLMDVAGTQVWLHNEKHSFDGDEVHVYHAHAIDMNLIAPPDGKPASTIGNQPNTAPTISLDTGQSGHKPDDVKPLGEDKKQTVSAMSNTRPDEGKAAKRY